MSYARDPFDTDFGPADECRIVEVDGEPVSVHASGDWTDEDHSAFAEIVRAAKAHYDAALSFPTDRTLVVHPLDVARYQEALPGITILPSMPIETPGELNA